MRYRNVKNGDVIESKCVISGDNWEPVEETAAEASSKEGVVGNNPAQKPKATRRSKK